MVQRESITQQEVNIVWGSVWKTQSVSAKQIFSHRLFIEGYKVFRKHIPKHARTLLEIGTGSGRYGVALARDFPALSVTATDIVPESLAASRKLAEEVGVRSIRFETADAQELQYENDSFDVVFSDAVVQHIPDEIRAIREMARVTRPGGVVIIAVVNRYSIHRVVRIVQQILGFRNEYRSEKFYSRRDLRRLVQGAGLTVIAESGFYPAYGMYRLKKHARLFGVLGRMLNRITTGIDTFTGGLVSSRVGFEIVVVGKKEAGGLPGAI